ncbi:MAG: hypothetical protein ABIP49_04985 [Lysobacterales bacterium]
MHGMWRRLFLIYAFAMLGAVPARAAIHRCVGPGGTDVFTDQPCQSLSMPSRDMRGTQSPADSEGSSLRPTGPRGLVAGCPASNAETLLAGFETGLARRDVNYLSGLFLWTGVSSASGREVTARLRRLVNRELLEIRLLPDADDRADFADAPLDWDPYVDPPPPRPLPTGLAIRHAAVGGEYSEGEETRLAIRERNECLWLAF